MRIVEFVMRKLGRCVHCHKKKVFRDEDVCPHCLHAQRFIAKGEQFSVSPKTPHMIYGKFIISLPRDRTGDVVFDIDGVVQFEDHKPLFIVKGGDNE